MNPTRTVLARAAAQHEKIMFQSTRLTARHLEELTPLPNSIIPLKGEVSNLSLSLMKTL